MLEEFLKCGAIIPLHKGDFLVGWGKRTWLEKPTQPSSPLFYFPDFFLSDAKPWFAHAHTKKMSAQELIALLKTEDPPSSLQWKNPYQSLFYDSFAGLQQKFADQELSKAVPFVFTEASVQMQQPMLQCSLHNILEHSTKQPIFVYGFWEDGLGMLGGTPELLFRKEQQKVHTVACAGTRKRDGTEHLLLEDPKERHEHQLVVDGITKALSPFGKVSAGSIQLLNLKTLSHLLTPMCIEGVVDFDVIVKALHPTPALGAFPREAGREWLRGYQRKIERSRFGAPVGCINGDEACCYVAIRNAQWDNEHIRIGAGCGIVEGSQVDREWAEINLKIEATKEMLAL